MPNTWQPSATFETMQQRAALLKNIRRFMEERAIMEVETPVLSLYGQTDPHIDNLETHLHLSGNGLATRMYLNTSPEFAMKRLIAAGTGSIYQITRAFRDGELARYHQPEFTMLEWYRTGFDHHELMNEIAELLLILGLPQAKTIPYAMIFESMTLINPHTTETRQLQNKAKDLGLQGESHDRGTLLDFIFSHVVVPKLEKSDPVFIYDFPVCQAALARIRRGEPDVAERFELFISGIEIANGFHELGDASEQLARFEDEISHRQKTGRPEMVVDSQLIAALEQGMPDCAGVAMGVDRLLMVLLDKAHIDEVLTFPLGPVDSRPI
jgi:lysyl-tRNA synthetase class 2